MTDQPFTPSMPVTQTRGTTPVILSPEAIHGPLKIGPSGAQVEQARQAGVAEGRALLLAHGGAFTATNPRPLHWGWSLLVCLFILGVVVWIATDDWYREVPGAPVIVPVGEATGTLAERLSALESEVAELQQQVARTEGNVEARIDAYSMIQANEIAKEQQP